MTDLIQEIESTPLGIINDLIEASRAQVERIVVAVLGSSCLAADVEQVLDTNALINEKLAAFAADERDCLATLGQLRADDFDRLPAFDGLDGEDANALRQTLMERLVMHLVDLRIAGSKLERGIELNRTAMIERFAIFSVAGLAQDGAHSVVSARAFVVAYLVAAQLKDRLETAGHRWTGDKTLITLYLHAVGSERRRSKERFVADPVASVIATRLGFHSARQLHQALFAWHLVKSRAASAASTASAEPSGQIGFDRTPCNAFRRQYMASAIAGDVFSGMMQRLRRPPAPC